MISTLDLLITRFLSISSTALIFGSQSIAIQTMSLGAGFPISAKAALIAFEPCTSSCSANGHAANHHQFVGSSSRDRHRVLDGFRNGAILSMLEFGDVSKMEFLEGNSVAGYTPPTCSDTDVDQTNNCGPGDSGDAGTRMSV